MTQDSSIGHPKDGKGGMLTLEDIEKERIRLEEAYRYEVRTQLAQDRDKPHKLWVFLNSSFALWLLSAICITWLGTIYTNRQKK